MIKNDNQASEYMSAIDQQFAGVMLSDEKKVELAVRARKAGVPEPIVDDWFMNRKSFEVDPSNPNYFTEESGAREAGFLEQFKSFGMTQEERDKANEQGVTFPSPENIVAKVGGDIALASGQLAASVNPLTAGATIPRVLSAATNQALKVGLGSSAKELIGSVIGGRDFNVRNIAADTFDAGTLAILPAFTSEYAKGALNRGIINGVGSAIYGSAESVASSKIRGTEIDPLNVFIGGISGGAEGFGAGYGSVASKESKIALDNLQTLRAAGIEKPPLGVVSPKYAAQLRAATESDLNVRAEVDNISSALKNSIINKVGGFGELSEPAVLTREVSKLSRKVPELEEKSSAAASAALRMAQEFSGKKELLRSGVTKSAKEIQSKRFGNAVESVKARANAAIDGFIGSFTTDKFLEATGGFDAPLTQGQARQNVKKIAAASRDAFKETANVLFDAVPEGSFQSEPIVGAIENAIDLAPESVKGTLKSALKNIPKEVAEDGTVSYGSATKQQWLNARNAIGEAIGTAARAPSPDDHWFGKITSAITDQMDKQKVSALGSEGAAKWDEARKYYRNVEAFNDTDVRQLLFGDNEANPLAKTLLNDMAINGVGPDSRYGRLEKSLQAHGNEQLAAQHKAFLSDTMRSYIVDISTNNDGNISPQLFVKALGEIPKRNDAMAKLGFNRNAVKQLSTAIQDYPEASKLTPKQISSLLDLAGSAKGTAQSKELVSALQDMAVQHAESKVGKAAVFEAMGLHKTARDEVYNARLAVKKAGLQESKINQLLVAAKNHPIYQNFANVQVSPDSYDSLFQTFFNPSSGKLANNDIKILMTGLRNGNKQQKQTAEAISVRFLNDAMMRATGATSNNEEAITLFANALTPSNDERSLYSRALHLFTPAQISAIRKEYGAAKVIAAYRKAADISTPSVANAASVAGPAVGTMTNLVPKGGSLGSAFRGASGLISSGKYALANLAYTVNPEGFLKTKDAAATIAKHIGNMNFAQRHQFMVQHADAIKEMEPEQEAQKSPQ